MAFYRRALQVKQTPRGWVPTLLAFATVPELPSPEGEIGIRESGQAAFETVGGPEIKRPFAVLPNN